MMTARNDELRRCCAEVSPTTNDCSLPRDRLPHRKHRPLLRGPEVKSNLFRSTTGDERRRISPPPSNAAATDSDDVQTISSIQPQQHQYISVDSLSVIRSQLMQSSLLATLPYSGGCDGVRGGFLSMAVGCDWSLPQLKHVTSRRRCSYTIDDILGLGGGGGNGNGTGGPDVRYSKAPLLSSSSPDDVVASSGWWTKIGEDIGSRGTVKEERVDHVGSNVTAVDSPLALDRRATRNDDEGISFNILIEYS